MHVKLRGKKYRLELHKRLPNGFDGFCGSPFQRQPAIETRKGLRGKAELLVYIHEILHALEWRWHEKRVENRSQDLAEALWKLGYRPTRRKVKKIKGNKTRITSHHRSGNTIKVSKQRHQAKRRLKS